MHTHQADCVSERRLRPRRPELHSTTMSQGLPSVDTHSKVIGVSACRRQGRRLTDPQTPAAAWRRWRDSRLLTLLLHSWPFLSPLPFIPSFSLISDGLSFLYFSHCCCPFDCITPPPPPPPHSLSVHQPNGSILSGMGYSQQLLKVQHTMNKHTAVV